MKIDVLIVSKNRQQLLEQCLASLDKAIARVEGANFSILLGLTNSNIPAIPPSLSIRPHAFAENMTAPEKRNALLLKSTADWIFFCDDDVEVPEDIFLNFLFLQKTNVKANVFGGPNLTPPNVSEVEREQGRLLGSPWRNPFFFYRYRKSRARYTTSSRFFCLCNLFVRHDSSTFFSHLQFCGEELQMLSELKRAGKIFFYDPRLWVYHHRRKTKLEFQHQIFNYGKGRGLFLSRSLSASQALALRFLLLPANKGKSPLWIYLAGVRAGLSFKTVVNNANSALFEKFKVDIALFLWGRK